jgi:hypothetical protein
MMLDLARPDEDTELEIGIVTVCVLGSHHIRPVYDLLLTQSSELEHACERCTGHTV